ncbi:MAG: endo alpha-1,4 polygalactosaminidase [Flavobacterium sp.]
MSQLNNWIVIVLLFITGFGSNTCQNTEKDKKVIEAGKKMQDFVIAISEYSRKQNPNFIIIPQNGAELTFIDCNPSNELHQAYMNAIDGIGIEELFYNEVFKPDIYRLEMLRKIADTKKVMVSEFIHHDDDIEDAMEKNLSEGFVSFIRTKENYHYKSVPETVQNENDKDISKLADIENYLYLINNSEYNTKEEFIKSIENNNSDLIIMDLYYLSFPFNKEDIQRLKIKKNGGKRLVISYINVGAAENWRTYWQPEWKKGNPKWLKKNYKGYDNEIIVEFWHTAWQKIIFGNKDSYLQNIINVEFDGVYLDNVEAYYTLYN